MKKLLSLLLVVAVLASCAVTVAFADSDAYLGVMLTTNVMSLDTNLATDGESFEVIANCIDGLTQMDADGAAVPAIAESYDVSEDGTVYTFHLRDAKWANGADVTAYDFEFAWKRIAQEAGEYAYLLDSSVGCVKNADAIIYEGADPDTLGVEAVDAKTFVVTLEVNISLPKRSHRAVPLDLDCQCERSLRISALFFHRL